MHMSTKIRYILRKSARGIFPLLCTLSGFAAGAQQLRLPAIFSDHMVLQQHAQLKVWGWAGPREGVKLVASWSRDTLHTYTDAFAEWQITLPTPSAGGPYQVTVFTKNSALIIHDVVIGEDWLCTGQSNMEFSASWRTMAHWQQDTATAHYPLIRFFHISNITATFPQVTVAGKWEICTPRSMFGFSAAGYFFGRALYRKLREPIGLIESCWGGTPVEAWMPDSIFKAHLKLAQSARVLLPAPWCPMVPSVCFNAMIAPIVSFPVAGAIWYQGETNVANPGTYEEDFSRMIRSWRNAWGKSFPFYFVQIAPFNYGNRDSAALVREAQLATYRNVSHTGMVVTTDITVDTNNIHPIDKRDIGDRLANWALANNYHLPDISFSGPLYRDMQIKKSHIRIYFDFAGSGLQIKGDSLTCIQIAGKDRHFYPANAVIRDSVLEVYSPSVPHPVAVQFGFSNTARPNLYNIQGLPASPFRTDDWPVQ